MILIRPTTWSVSLPGIFASLQRCLSDPLSINLNLHTSSVHPLPGPRLLHPRGKPGLRLPVEVGPLRHHDEERQRCAAEPDVECFVDVLRDEANEDGDDAGSDEEEGRKEVGEALAVKVLLGALVRLFTVDKGEKERRHTISPSQMSRAWSRRASMVVRIVCEFDASWCLSKLVCCYAISARDWSEKV